MAKKIDESICVGCGVCERVCIVGCISEAAEGKRRVDEAACVECGACELSCPVGAVS